MPASPDQIERNQHLSLHKKMAAILKALASFLTLATVVAVNGQCSLRNLEVHQNQTGALVQGKPEWSVNILNTCRPELCILKNVKLNCSGFQTVKPINPSILSVSGDVCFVKIGKAITTHDVVNFKYAWSYLFPLNPISSDILCA